ncbi:MAG: hypothetical protein ACYC1M_12120 [Armatimonadota bacterium]
MIKVKNVRPGLLLIADAGLKLTPGGTASVETLTPQMNRCIEDGLLTRIEQVTGPEPEPEPKPELKARPRSSGKAVEAKAPSAAKGNVTESAAITDGAKQAALPIDTPGENVGS